jgi:hypothetical protein
MPLEERGHFLFGCELAAARLLAAFLPGRARLVVKLDRFAAPRSDRK